MPKRSNTMNVGQLREALAFLPADMELYVVGTHPADNGPELMEVTALRTADALVRECEWRGVSADAVAALRPWLREDELYVTLCRFA